jgi:alpha-glucosidase
MDTAIDTTETLGAVVETSRDERGHLLRLQRGLARIEGVAEDVCRITVSGHETLQPYRSYALAGPVQTLPLELVEEGDRLVFGSGSIRVAVSRTSFAVDLHGAGGASLSGGLPFTRERRSLSDHRRAPAGEDYYGLGERITPLGRRGYIVENWNRDKFDHHNETDKNLYLSLPFMVGYRPESGELWGYFLDSSYRSSFDVASTNPERLEIRVERGDFVLYLFAAPSWGELLESYTSFTGRHSVPPLWALGHHQSRYGYMTTAEAWEVATEMRRRKLPCDAIWYDIDHMDGFRVFTFDPDRFADVKDHFWGLGERGFRKVVIVDPGVKVDPPGTYRVMDDGTRHGYFLTLLNGEDFVGPVWPGGTKFPDFTRPEVREWWGDLHRLYLDIGVDGIWNDMNEPAVMDERETIPEEVRACDEGYWSTQDRMHNVYALFEARATVEALRRHRPGLRPFLLTRAGSPGIQRYAALWTGDNSSTWAHLRASVGQLINLGLSGIGFCGADVGGFSENAQPELLARWYQLAAFYPFLRNHSMKGSIPQEPWVFGPEVERICREALELRYRLLPYIYQLFHEMSRTGAPVLRPLFWHYPGERSASVADQFLLGPHLLVCPVLHKGARERLVWLPPGSWYDYHEHTSLEGGVSVVAPAPLERVPLFVAAGAVIPVAVPMQSTADWDAGTLILEVWTGADTSGRWLEDDGLSDQVPVEHRYVLNGDSLEITLSDKTRYKTIEVRCLDPRTRRWRVARSEVSPRIVVRTGGSDSG